MWYYGNLITYKTHNLTFISVMLDRQLTDQSEIAVDGSQTHD